jgi:hypothetical protein
MPKKYNYTKKAGRPRMFKSPDQIWDAFNRYRTWAKSNPILVHDFVGKDGNSVYRERERPLTQEGFEEYLADQEDDLGYRVEKYLDGSYDDFLGIASRIKRIIRNDQVVGAMTSIYNSNITARLNGLVDKAETRQIVEQPLFLEEETKEIDHEEVEPIKLEIKTKQVSE